MHKDHLASSHWNRDQVSRTISCNQSATNDVTRWCVRVCSCVQDILVQVGDIVKEVCLHYVLIFFSWAFYWFLTVCLICLYLCVTQQFINWSTLLLYLSLIWFWLELVESTLWVKFSRKAGRFNPALVLGCYAPKANTLNCTSTIWR